MDKTSVLSHFKWKNVKTPRAVELLKNFTGTGIRTGDFCLLGLADILILFTYSWVHSSSHNSDGPKKVTSKPFLDEY